MLRFSTCQSQIQEHLDASSLPEIIQTILQRRVLRLMQSTMAFVPVTVQLRVIAVPTPSIEVVVGFSRNKELEVFTSYSEVLLPGQLVPTDTRLISAMNHNPIDCQTVSHVQALMLIPVMLQKLGLRSYH